MTTVTRHSEFYFDEPDTVVFKVQNTLFRPHKLILTRYCQYFRDSLDFAQLGEGGYGTTDENPIELQDVRISEDKTIPEVSNTQFALGLTMLYPEYSLKFLRKMQCPYGDLQTILEVGRRWGCDLIKSIVVDFFHDAAVLSLRQRLQLGAEYELNSWLPKAFAELCLQLEISDEIQPLSFARQVQFYQIRDRFRKDLALWIQMTDSYHSSSKGTCEWATLPARVARLLSGLGGLSHGASMLDANQLINYGSLCGDCQTKVEEWKDGLRYIALARATVGLFPEVGKVSGCSVMHPSRGRLFSIE